MFSVFNQYLLTLGWIFALFLITGAALPMFVWLFNKLTGEIDIWKEIQRKNMAVSVIIGSAILGVTILIGLAI